MLEYSIAHILYLHNGQPVSLFMLPDAQQPPRELEVLGHAGIIWASGGQTFVLMGPAGDNGLAALARYIRDSVGQ